VYLYLIFYLCFFILVEEDQKHHMSLSFGAERLQFAVQQLATGTGSIQTRLMEAYKTVSTLYPNEDLNFRAQKDFDDLNESFKSTKPGEESKLDPEVAGKLAAKILEMFISVMKAEAVEEFSRKNLSIK
jgi:hypothetical protein